MTQPRITITWGKISEQGEVKYSREYMETYTLLRLDMLKDAMFALEQEYGKQFKKWQEEFAIRRKESKRKKK